MSVATKAKSPLDKLSLKRRIFVMEFCADMNPVRAAKEAGYKSTNLKSTANKILDAQEVKDAIAHLLKPRMVNAGLTVERLQEQLGNFIFRDVLDFVDEDGYMKTNIADLPERARQCIESWECDDVYEYDPDTHEREIVGRKLRVKLVPKSKAIELAMKFLGMLGPDIHQHNTQVNVLLQQLFGQPETVTQLTVEQRIEELLQDDKQQ